GSLALSDTFLQNVVGHGIAGRLSAKLGEGTVNGIMTARVGIAAMSLCRPLPFAALKAPGLTDLASEVVSFGKAGDANHEKKG
ncbi:MAG: DUF697 domain-containing protein, partial [Alphaproteobacteria bacterium]|nr:DUF697 domain-containing protein [Alphaproteobacteria bacterium]